MKRLLAWASVIDRITDGFADLAKWAIVAACVISAGNALIRYLVGISSNAFLEIQWYLFAVAVMCGTAQVLRLNEHVRVDVLYGLYRPRVQVWVDLFGFVVFLLPVAFVMMYFAVPLLERMIVTQEMSSNAGGLVRWPVTLTMPLGFALLVLQAASEIIKRVGWLRHEFQMDTHYERPLQ